MSPRAFLARELAPSHLRFVEATRTALKATVTTGLAAILQIVGPFGPLFAFRIGQPGISLGLFEGILTITCAAAMQAAIVPITGKLLDYPGLILAFLFVVFAAIAYLLSNTKLFLILALVAVGTITTVYVGIFEPGRIGWGSTYTFDGILAATLVMVAVDTWIWPSHALPRLLESIATDLERTRKRLQLVAKCYIDTAAASVPAIQVASRLAPHLALLKSVEESAKETPARLAALLDAVVTSERVFLEVERLAVLAADRASGGIGREARDQLQVVLNVLDETLAQRIEVVLANIPDSATTEVHASDLPAALRCLSDLSAQTSAVANSRAESSSFGEFLDVLATIANLLEPQAPSMGTRTIEESAAEDFFGPHPLIDATRFRFSVKLGATMVLGLLVGLTTQRADLQTILWSIAVAGQPNQYGAILRKTILRLGGCLIGGLATLGAMLVVSENFDSLVPYLAAILAVMALSTYVAQSSEWLGYAGIQAGITFLICYVGLGPSTDIYRPLWRFWGIVLGVLTTGFVFLFLWPEYASDKLIGSLSTLMRTTLAFAKGVADGTVTEGQVAVAERRLSKNLLEVLEMADQARLEGRLGLANSTNGIAAAATLIRIAYRFRIIARRQHSEAEATLSPDLLKRCSALERECCLALESKLQRFESGGSSREFSSSPPQPTIDLTAMARELAERQTSESARSSAEVNATVAQLESYRRLPILLETLDTALSKIAAS